MNNISELMELMPTGVRFHPNKEEIVNVYLKPKNRGGDSQNCVIPDIDVCKHEPWELPDIVLGNSVIKTKDQEWFFFSPLEFKYSNSHRLKRTTESGFWKPTGKNREIVTSGNVTAIKKTVVFYKGRVPNEVKTNWVIHEYHETGTLPNQSTFVLCRLRIKEDDKTKATTSDEGEPSSSYINASDVENSVPEHTIPEFPVNKKRKLGLLPANACNDDFNGMPSQFGTTGQEEDLREFSKEFISLDDLDNSVSEHTIPEFPVNKKQELGLPPANAYNDDFNGMPSQFGTTEQEDLTEFCNGFISLDDLENSVSVHTIPEPQINNQKEPSVVGFPSANSCSDNCNQMQSQFVTTKQEEDDTEFWKEIYLKLDKYSREEMMQCISNDFSTLESVGKVDYGEISSATHSGTAQALYERSWELQLCGYSSNKESQWLERGGTNAKKGLKLTMDGSAGNCYPGSCTIWDLALDFIKKVWRLFHLSNFSLVGYFMDSLVLVVLLYYPIA